MDLNRYSLKDVILAALKSEIESKKVYLQLAEDVNNFLFKDRMKFLADEEEKHRQIFAAIFEDRFPDEKLQLPEQSPVPLPEIDYEKEKTPVSSVLTQVMDAEQTAYDFYNSMVALFPDNKGIQSMLTYIARMELSHCKILEIEKESAEIIEDADVVWPMIHLGP